MITPTVTQFLFLSITYLSIGFGTHYLSVENPSTQSYVQNQIMFQVTTSTQIARAMPSQTR